MAVKPLTNIEQVALKMFEMKILAAPRETIVNATPKDLKDIMSAAFILSYQFLDISNDYRRKYD